MPSSLVRLPAAILRFQSKSSLPPLVAPQELSSLSDTVSGDTQVGHTLVELSQDFGSETAVQLMSWHFQNCLLFFLKAPFFLLAPIPRAAVEFHTPRSQLMSEGIVLGWQFYRN